MKKILFQKDIDFAQKTKALAISQKSQDEESFTHIRKRFVYQVAQVTNTQEDLEGPQIKICKQIDHKRRIERFHFQVYGSFFMNHNRSILKVGFQHTLDIDILWKHFSSKKSAILA
ncbi:MAG: hypothetical protein HQL23_06755 [Candidatus Omnitrophica bacterium]|nr:hypothetical protein [Candidatus Omnitrophota bacterium]